MSAGFGLGTSASWAARLVSLILVAGCTAEIKNNAYVMGLSFADIKQAQVMGNIARFWTDPDTLPSQFELQPGTVQANKNVTTGIAPNIALRAIAITGLKLEGTLEYNQQLGIIPVVGVSDLTLLRLLYRYAVRTPDGPREFDALLTEFRKRTRPRSSSSTSINPDRYDLLLQLIGPLPDGPLTGRETECTEDRLNKTRTIIDGSLYCFLGGGEVLAKFTLWAAALTQDITFHTVDQPEAADARPGGRLGRPSTRPRPTEPAAAPSQPLPGSFSVRPRPETAIPTPFSFSPKY